VLVINDTAQNALKATGPQDQIEPFLVSCNKGGKDGAGISMFFMDGPFNLQRSVSQTEITIAIRCMGN
jgi:hypothetical protein